MTSRKKGREALAVGKLSARILRIIKVGVRLRIKVTPNHSHGMIYAVKVVALPANRRAIWPRIASRRKKKIKINSLLSSFCLIF